MLPARHRMRRSDDFSDAVRRGARSGASRVVVHLRLARQHPETDQDGSTVLVGFIVPKSVGTAVHRNHVKRRLRALMRDRLPQLPPGCRVVVRALPGAATAPFDALARDLDVALLAARRRADGRRPAGRAGG
ncbi:ribonuclease P protein component [Georgenia sp. SYP-B2076]|uniref:ribonuclease P protein component n=1 Tax=Georgenia sp. SYP-B2076 TaxID=2495881 RepID=UPI000F8E9B8D|nr:ribonuclease P protein component [Georgenia sp. SYP-B2076]